MTALGEVPGNAGMPPGLPDGFLVRLQVFNVHPEGNSRVIAQSVMIERGGGHQVEALRCERAAHQLAVVMGAEIEVKGWALRKPRPRPPIGPERQPGMGDE